MVQSRKFRVAILECDRTVPKVGDVYGPYYGVLFVQPLKEAAQRSGTGTELEFNSWDVVEDKYPNPDDIDGIVITGSHSSVYHKDPWIHKLCEFLRQTYQNHPRVRIFGSCFGHQVIAHALLDRQKTIIERDPKGYELGVGTLDLSPSFTSAFRQFLAPESPSKLRIQFSHGDHVHCLPGSLPPTWQCIGRTKHCDNQGLFEPDRVLTFQGHFEFDSSVTTEIIKYFYTVEAGFSPNVVQDALEAAARPADTDRLADILFAFLTAKM